MEEQERTEKKRQTKQKKVVQSLVFLYFLPRPISCCVCLCFIGLWGRLVCFVALLACGLAHRRLRHRSRVLFRRRRTTFPSCFVGKTSRMPLRRMGTRRPSYSDLPETRGQVTVGLDRKRIESSLEECLPKTHSAVWKL